MTKTIIAASILALTAALPAFAAEEYQAGLSSPIADAVATSDVGSAAYPHFDGSLVMLGPNSGLVLGNASSATVEPLNSAPVGALADLPGLGR